MFLWRFALRAAFACALLAYAHPAPAFEGLVSFYGAEHGQARRRTASGARFVPSGRTCAHWTLAFGSRVRVSDPVTGRSVECVVNDRGPHPRLRRALDLAQGAAAHLGILRRGVIRARLEILGHARGRRR